VNPNPKATADCRAPSNDSYPAVILSPCMSAIGRLPPHGWRSPANSPFRPEVDDHDRRHSGRSVVLHAFAER